MKRILSTALILSMAVGFGCMINVEAATVVNQEEKGFISVTTTANTELMPDVVEISVAVKTEDSKSLQNATLRNKEISDNVYTALNLFIDTSKGDFIKTANYSASPQYVYTNKKRVLDKYVVSNNVIIHTKNIAQAGDIIDKAIALGATNVNSINFSVSDYDTKCNDLIAIATKKAKTRASVIAENADSAIIGIKGVTLSCNMNGNSQTQYRLMSKNMAMDSAVGAEVPEVSTPIQSGVMKLFANVNASFFVK